MTWILSGIALAAGLVVGAGAVLLAWRRHAQASPIAARLLKHLGTANPNDVTTRRRELPVRTAVDAQRGLLEWIERRAEVIDLLGVPVRTSYMESVSVGSLLSNDPYGQRPEPTAIEYQAIEIGESKPVDVHTHAVWTLRIDGRPAVLLWTSSVQYRGRGPSEKLKIELGFVDKTAGAAWAEELFEAVEQAVTSGFAFRGKVLSLEASEESAGGVKVHRLRRVERDQLVLPEETVRRLDRNVVRFAEQRGALRRLGMPARKGVLFHGPPGVGKTHTIHYLHGSLDGHTTLLITAEQIGLLDEYMTLARLLQPSVVVIEDVDLIGRDRRRSNTCDQSILNRLLNEMDGLREDAEILFLLTTNRPEALEAALADRPGRVDQAIEFPLPDLDGRRKLARLYARGAELDEEVVEQIARRTEGVSAAFIKELLRRAMQFRLECQAEPNGRVRILGNDVDQAIDELLGAGALNRALLGGVED